MNERDDLILACSQCRLHPLGLANPVLGTKRIAVFVRYEAVYVGGIGLQPNALNDLHKFWKSAQSRFRLSGLP
jgi:hypothetical protein